VDSPLQVVVGLIILAAALARPRCATGWPRCCWWGTGYGCGVIFVFRRARPCVTQFLVET
jgi:hypothetical protein